VACLEAVMNLSRDEVSRSLRILLLSFVPIILSTNAHASAPARVGLTPRCWSMNLKPQSEMDRLTSQHGRFPGCWLLVAAGGVPDVVLEAASPTIATLQCVSRLVSSKPERSHKWSSVWDWHGARSSLAD